MGLEDRGGSCNMYIVRKGSLCFSGIVRKSTSSIRGPMTVLEPSISLLYGEARNKSDSSVPGIRFYE